MKKGILISILLCDILFIIIAILCMILAVKEENRLGFWGYLCASIWCLNCLVRDIREIKL